MLYISTLIRERRGEGERKDIDEGDRIHIKMT